MATNPGEVMQMPGKKKIDVSKFEETYKRTRNIREAMLAAGYSEGSANRCRAGLNNACMRVMERIDAGVVSSPSDPEEMTPEQFKERLAEVKAGGPEAMIGLLLEVCGEYIIGRKPIPKGLDSMIKLAGSLKGSNAFSNGERGEGIFHVQFPSAEQVAAAFASKSPAAEEWEEKDFEAGAAILYPLPGLPNWYSDRRGTEVRISVLSALPAGSMKAESEPTAEEAFFSEELPPIPLQN